MLYITLSKPSTYCVKRKYAEFLVRRGEMGYESEQKRQSRREGGGKKERFLHFPFSFFLLSLRKQHMWPNRLRPCHWCARPERRASTSQFIRVQPRLLRSSGKWTNGKSSVFFPPFLPLFFSFSYSLSLSASLPKIFYLSTEYCSNYFEKRDD